MNDLSLTNEISTTWIENLALEELNMDESGIVTMNDHLSPEHLLEESSIKFLDKLRDAVEVYVEKFNQFRGRSDRNTQIKVFKISGTVNDFMLFRSSLRLVFTRRSNDLISIGFLGQNGTLLPARISVASPYSESTAHDIKAHIGPFNKITWRYEGEEVEIHTLVKHYLSEFIKQSAR